MDYEDRDDDERVMVRDTDPDTSLVSAITAAEKAPRLREKILEIAENAGSNGIIMDDATEAVGNHVRWHTISPAMSQLKQLGMLRVDGVRRGLSGKAQELCFYVTPENRPKQREIYAEDKRKEDTKQIYKHPVGQQLLARIRELEEELDELKGVVRD